VSARRVVVLAPEPIRPRMAGMGIRALELARALSVEFAVRLLVPNDAAEAREVAGPLDVEPAVSGRLAAAAVGAHAAIVSGHAANAWFHEVPDVPVAVDLYDPFPVENLHYVGTLGDGPSRHDLATLSLALRRGDFFLCASEEQRLFYCGALFAAGRIGAGNFPEDPALRGLVAVVPFGAPSEPARGDRVRGRRSAGVPESGPLVLFGGVYDWYDPRLLLDAWPTIRARRADARLLFFENPNPDSTPQQVFEDVRRRAREMDSAGASLVFSPWLAYADRADLYAACELAVSIASDGLETELAYRTRLLDAAWGGVPAVAVGGGSLARELAASGAGFECARDSAMLAGRVATLLEDAPARERAAAAGRAFAAARTWETVTRPVAQWCRTASVDPGRGSARAPEAGSLWKRLFQ
jgi:glycosyltransferase involved in cell wall biosynthesis